MICSKVPWTFPIIFFLRLQGLHSLFTDWIIHFWCRFLAVRNISGDPFWKMYLKNKGQKRYALAYWLSLRPYNASVSISSLQPPRFVLHISVAVDDRLDTPTGARWGSRYCQSECWHDLMLSKLNVLFPAACITFQPRAQWMGVISIYEILVWIEGFVYNSIIFMRNIWLKCEVLGFKYILKVI